MRVILIIMFILFFLTSCSGQDKSIRDLQNNLVKVKQDALKKQIKKPSIILPPPQPAVYQSSTLRSPFEAKVTLKAGVKAAHPLNAYPFNMLRFVGTISENNQMRGIIVTPDNKMYEVKVGDAIGDRYGRITNIYSDKLEVLEKTEEDGKQVTQRIITMQLKEGS